MLTRGLLAFVRASLPEPPARVLEIGAGEGQLALALGSAGYEVTAIDPAAEPESHVQRHSLLEVTGSFDAALAVVALHHVDPLEESIAHLATMLAPGAALVIDEIDVDRYDERAARWWLGQRHALGLSEDEDDPTRMVSSVREHIRPLSGVHAALRPHFELGESIPGPYLHRWGLGPELHDEEVDRIGEGLLPAVGSRLIAIRTGDGSAESA